MKTLKFNLVCLICILAFFQGTAAARVYVSIGLGTSFGHHHSSFYRPWYPYRSWHSHYYGWPGYYHWSSPWYSTGTGIRLYESYPTVIVPRVHVEAPDASANQRETVNDPVLSESMRKHKSELLKVLRIGDKDARINAIRELAGFSYDEKARTTLEKVLLSDPDPQLRKEVAAAFGKTGNVSLVPALKAAKSNDSSRDVRQAAYRSIILLEGY